MIPVFYILTFIVLLFPCTSSHAISKRYAAEQVWCTPSNDTRDHRIAFTITAPYHTKNQDGTLYPNVHEDSINYETQLWNNECNNLLDHGYLNSRVKNKDFIVNDTARFSVSIESTAVWQPKGYLCLRNNPAAIPSKNATTDELAWYAEQEQLCESYQTYYYCSDDQSIGQACGISTASIRIQTQSDGIGWRNQWSRLNDHIKAYEGDHACNCAPFTSPFNDGDFTVFACGCNVSMYLERNDSLTGLEVSCDNSATECWREGKQNPGTPMPYPGYGWAEESG